MEAGAAERSSGTLALGKAKPAGQAAAQRPASRQKELAGDKEISDSGGEVPQCARQSSGLRGVDAPDPGLSSDPAKGSAAGMSAAAAAVAAARAPLGLAAAPAAASSVSRSSDAVCAKKQTGREQLGPSLHSCVRYLQQGFESVRT